MQRTMKLRISLELGKALLELKDTAIVHCDIKPANTVLHQPIGSCHPVVKLIDFGEANTVKEAQGDIAGTPGYMAPEMESDGCVPAPSFSL